MVKNSDLLNGKIENKKGEAKRKEKEKTVS
jgi:hypothetical protein